MRIAAKKPAWGSVQTAAAVSIKDQELEASQKTAKPGRVSTPADREGGRSSSQASSDRGNGGYSGRTGGYGGDRPSYGGDRPSYGGDRPSYGGDRPSYGGDRPSYGGSSRGGDRPSYGDRSSSGGYSGSYQGRGQRDEDDSRGEQRMRYNPDMPSHGGVRGDRGDRAPRERVEVPFPTSAPYILYLTGLPYAGTESEVRELLPEFWGEELAPKVKNVKVPIMNGRLKHAFIEFEDADSLRAALTNDGREFMGRTATCLVAEPPKNDRFGGSSRGGDGRSGGFGSGFGTSYNPDRPSYPSSRGGYNHDSAPAERPRLNIAPRSTETPSSDSGASSAKSNPFGSATASVKDIYADKPRAPVTPVSPPTKGTGSRDQGRRGADQKTEVESRAETRDWKSKGDFKPTSSGFRAAPAAAAGKPSSDRRQGGRGNSRFSEDGEGDWKTTGGRSGPQQGAQKSQKPAPLSTPTSASTDKGNIFDNLGDE